MSTQKLTIDGNQAVAMIAHKLNEVIAIYPITPSSSMGEWADEWSSRGQKNLWGVKQRPILTTFTADFISLHKLITFKKQGNKNFTWSILTLFTGQYWMLIDNVLLITT